MINRIYYSSIYYKFSNNIKILKKKKDEISKLIYFLNVILKLIDKEDK